MSLQHAPLFSWKTRRLHLLLLVMFGLFNSQYMNTNLGITITCMVNYTAVDGLIPFDDNSTEYLNVTENACGRSETGEQKVLDYGGTLEWSRSEQNWLFSASFWGGVTTVIPSILISHRLSPRIVFAVSIAMKAVANALLPILARTSFSFYGVFAARFALGLAEPFIYPAINTIIGNWFPMEERSTAVALFTTGNQLAMFIGNPIAAWLCHSKLGWPAVYYMTAILGFIWLALWMSFAHNRPSQAKWMMRNERIYLLKTVPPRPKADAHPRPPVKAIATNAAFLSHLFSTYSITVGATFMITYLPSYFKQVLYLGLLTNGAFTSLPMMFNFTFKIIWGVAVDKLKSKKYLTPTQAVKLSQCFPTFGVAIPLFFIILFVDCTHAGVALLLFSIANMFMGGHTSGAYTSLLSLAPQYTPTLSSISHAFSVISQLTSPFIVHALISKGTVTEWNRMLLFTAILSVVSGAQFLIWGSGEIQDFAKTKEEKVATVEEGKEKATLLVEGAGEKDVFLRPLHHSFRADSVSLL